MCDPKTIAIQFNDCINSQDADGLAALMAEDHVFVDYENGRHPGKKEMSKGWATFFKDFPDYRNHFETVDFINGLVVNTGHATCKHPALSGRFLWSAKIEYDLVQEWRVLKDTEDNRRELGLPIP